MKVAEEEICYKKKETFFYVDQTSNLPQIRRRLLHLLLGKTGVLSVEVGQAGQQRPLEHRCLLPHLWPSLVQVVPPVKGLPMGQFWATH